MGLLESANLPVSNPLVIAARNFYLDLYFFRGETFELATSTITERKFCLNLPQMTQVAPLGRYFVEMFILLEFVMYIYRWLGHPQ